MLIKVLFCLAFFISSLFAGYPYAEKDHIINLGDPTWEVAAKEFPQGLFVYFYEPYCNPCRRLWPELVDAAKALSDGHSSSAVRFAKIECHDEIDLCNARKVFTFPSLILYVQGREPFEYRGARNSHNIQQWLHKVVDSKYPTIDQESDLFKKFSAALLVNSKNLTNVNSAYQNNFESVEIAVAGPKLKKKLSESPAALITQKGEITLLNVDYSPPTINQLIREPLFVKKSVAPYLTSSLYSQLSKDENLNLMIFFKALKFKAQGDDSRAFDEIYNQLQSQEIQFAYVNVDDDMIGHNLGKLFGLDSNSEPTIGMISRLDKFNRKYKLTGAINVENIRKFVQDFQNNQLPRYYMSSSPGPSVKPGSVEELGATKYLSVVNDPKLNVFVQFYFPWCEECVKLEPTWNKLAYRLRNHKNVKIVKVNINENDIEGFDNIKCPHLVLHPEGHDEQFVFEGANMNIQNLQKFLSSKIPGLLQDFEL